MFADIRLILLRWVTYVYIYIIYIYIYIIYIYILAFLEYVNLVEYIFFLPIWSVGVSDNNRLHNN